MINLCILKSDEYKELDSSLGKNSEVGLTDFSIITGAFLTGRKNDNNEVGYYWTNDEYYNVMGLNKFIRHQNSDARTISCRLALRYTNEDELSDYITSIECTENGKYYEMGEYPQEVVSVSLNDTLEDKYRNNKLKQMDNKYKVCSDNYYSIPSKHSYEELNVYEYNNRKYVRVKVNTYFAEKGLAVNNHYLFNKEYVWVKIKPIRWIKKKDENLLVSEKLITNYSLNDFYDRSDSIKDELLSSSGFNKKRKLVK